MVPRTIAVEDTPVSDRSSPISDLIRGGILSKIRCSDCDFERRNVDPSFSFELEIPSSGSGRLSLNALLDNYITAETPEGFVCGKDYGPDDGCSMEGTTEKALKIRPGQLVIFSLKIFTVDANGVPQKIKTRVEFPLTDLNLGQYSDEEDTDQIYDLVGVINHTGESALAGHYFSFVLNDN